MLGINPGRLGGGLTGIPFTDPKSIKDKLDIIFLILFFPNIIYNFDTHLSIDFPGVETIFGKTRKEPSGEFIHNFIAEVCFIFRNFKYIYIYKK